MVIVVCTLHPSSHTYEDLLKKRAEQQEPALTWQASVATGKEAGKNRGGRDSHQGAMGTPLTCRWRTQCSGRAGCNYLAAEEDK